MLKRLLLAVALVGAFVPCGAEATSTIDTTQPVQGVPYNAAPIRQNFGAAANDINALQRLNAGATAPSSPGTGTLWLQTPSSGTTYTLKMYVSTTHSWVPIAAFDAAAGLLMPPVGGGTLPSLVSAGTTNLGSVPQAALYVTGVQSIASFGSSAPAGQIKFVIFTDTPTLIYNATFMLLPGAADLTVAAGDMALAMSLGGGRWKVVPVNGAGSGSTVVAGCGLEREASGSSQTLSWSGRTAYTDANGDVFLSPDSNYNALTDALTTVRTWVLPPAAFMRPGCIIKIADEAGGVNSSNQLILGTSGTDLINGGAGYALDAAYSSALAISDGVSNWTVLAGAGTTTSGVVAGCGLASRLVGADTEVSASGYRAYTDADGDVLLSPSDNYNALTDALTTERIWTLPPASFVLPGCAIKIADEWGGLTAVNRLIIETSGADLINGGAGYPMDAGYSALYVISDGVSEWTVIANVVGIACADLIDSGTACLADTGTSGHTVPFLDGINIWSGDNAFATVRGTVRSVSGTTDTLSSADCGGTVVYTSASAVTVETFTNAAPTYSCSIAIYQKGIGAVSIANGVSATSVSSHACTKTFGQYAILGLFVQPGAPSEWNIGGDCAP